MRIIMKIKSPRFYLIEYIFTQIAFAVIYFVAWLYNPCSFLLNEDINKNPIGAIRKIVWKGKNPKIQLKQDDVTLSDMSKQVSSVKNNLAINQSQQNSLQKELDQLSLEIDKVIDDNNLIQARKVSDYKSQEFNSFRQNIEKKNEVIRLLEEQYTHDPNRWHPMDLAVANARLDLANAKL